MEPRVAVSTVVRRSVYKEGGPPCGHEEILVLRRADNGKWNFPGGKLEPPETLAEAAAREVLEETGLEVRPNRIATVFSNGTDDGSTFVFVMFEAPIIIWRLDFVVRINSEHTEYRWVTDQQLKDEIVPEALPRLKAFSMGDRAPMSGIYHRDPTEYSWYQGEYGKIGKAADG